MFNCSINEDEEIGKLKPVQFPQVKKGEQAPSLLLPS
jgi:hypothetical protein